MNLLSESQHFSSLEDDIPVTSLPCQWKPPKQRKESTLPMAQAQFEKHTYGKTKKQRLALLDDFDPRSMKYRGTAANNLPTLLKKIVLISVLFDKRFQISYESGYAHILCTTCGCAAGYVSALVHVHTH